jgi:hypothetical protein
MIRRWIVGVGCAVLCVFVFQSTPVSATSLKISPLRYDTSLASGEKKKGFVDVTNPSTQTVKVKLSVQAFRQTDNSGSLEFYDSETIHAGVLLDYSEAEIGPRETLHLAFVLDGAKLASGDNFATIFAHSVPDDDGAGEQTVRVGTLLLIENGTPSAHEAAIQNLSGYPIQFSDGLRVSFGVHNTAEERTATGFSPTITVRAWPYIDDTVTGPLVFAGRTRSVDYVKKGNYLGILAVHVKTGTSEQVLYSVLITGYWRFLVPILVCAAGFTIWFIRYARKSSNNSSTTPPLHD